MKAGMLWFDDDEEFTILERAHRAVKYFFGKYGYMPDTIMVSEHDLADEVDMEGICIIPSRTVLKYHFYVGLATD